VSYDQEYCLKLFEAEKWHQIISGVFGPQKIQCLAYTISPSLATISFAFKKDFKKKTKKENKSSALISGIRK